MNISPFKLMICISSILLGILLIQILNVTTYTQANLNFLFSQLFSKRVLENELCLIAKLNSVKVLAGNSWGSGILIQKQGSQYSLVTNGHVLKEKKEKYMIYTHDGLKHQAFILIRFDNSKSMGYDLAILQFSSPVNYRVATLGKWTGKEKVMAAGFPLDVASFPSGFMCTKLGQVSHKLKQSMQNGYQLGTFLSIKNGMSGGPLLNTQGKVIGINGMGEPAIFTNHDIYLYRDGSRVSESLELPPDKVLESLASSSWAIPSETVVYLSPSSLKLQIDASKSKTHQSYTKKRNFS